MSKPEFCVLKTDGINCDEETKYALENSGANARIVHINQLRSGDDKLSKFDGLVMPGGFSYGDDIASGKVLAVEFSSYLSDELNTFVDDKKPILGVCNGFQFLVKTGLLPNGKLGEQSVTLTNNERGHFECRWVDLAIGESACKFITKNDFENQLIPMQIAHGEGRFYGDEDEISQLKNKNQIDFRYAVGSNPNGSIDNIAGICDESGLILGMMPHPERSIDSFHPHRVKTELARRAAKLIFDNIVNYTKQS